MGAPAQQHRAALACRLLLGALLVGSGAHAAEPAGHDEAFPTDSWQHLRHGIRQLADGKVKAAQRAFREAGARGDAALPALLLDLSRAHASLPREAAPLLDSAIDRSADVPEPHFREALRQMRAVLNEEDPAAPARRLRALLCNVRLLARDRATDGEKVVLEPRAGGGTYSRPRQIFAPLAPYPPEARAAGVARLIIMEHIIDSEGCTVRASVRAIRPLGLAPTAEEVARATQEDHFGLGRAAANISRWWAQEPARLDGEPVAVKHSAMVSFALR